jgi:hypothetical protein
MLKKIGLTTIALLGMLSMAPHPAKAAVRIGIGVGVPAYTYPAYPVYPAYPPAYPPVAVTVTPGPFLVGRPAIRHDYHWDRRHDSFRR